MKTEKIEFKVQHGAFFRWGKWLFNSSEWSNGRKPGRTFTWGRMKGLQVEEDFIDPVNDGMIEEAILLTPIKKTKPKKGKVERTTFSLQIPKSEIKNVIKLLKQFV